MANDRENSTVRDLIEYLDGLDPDMPVVRTSTCGCYRNTSYLKRPEDVMEIANTADPILGLAYQETEVTVLHIQH